MPRLSPFLLLLVAAPLLAQSGEAALQRAFLYGAQQLEAGNAAQAERAFRAMLAHTASPRVKLELARSLYAQEKYSEAKTLVQEVASHAETPWRVRDNIEHFVRAIEEKTGYLKLGATLVADSNPRSIPPQKEFAIGDLRLTPTEAPETERGVRYSARGWLPLDAEKGLAGYLAASYSDYRGEALDRLTLDVGAVRPLVASGWLRAKVGLEAATFAGKGLYYFPYVGLDAVLGQSERSRLTGEFKAGHVRFFDFEHLDAEHASAAMSLTRSIADYASVSLSGSVERSVAAEKPYSYYGLEAGPGFSVLLPASAYLIGARASLGARKYGAADPFFGERRSDKRSRLELTLGNKRWRWRDASVSLVACLERNRSNLEFYGYRKAGLSVAVE